MPIKTYDSQEAVPEAHRASAIETKDGKFIVDEPDPTLGEKGERALEAAKAAQREEEKRRKAAEKERDDLKRAAEAREKGISEEALAEIRRKEEAARKPIEDERDQLAAENRKLKLTDRVQALFLKYEGMPDRVEDAMDQLAKRTDLGDAGGIVYKDKAGTITADSEEAFFKKFKTEKPWLFKGTGASGSGASGSSGSADDVPSASEATKEAKRREVAGAF